MVLEFTFNNKKFYGEQDAWHRSNGNSTLRMQYKLNEDSVVFDIGGYEGWYSEQLYNKFNCNIYIFEPYKPFYDVLEQKFRGNDKVRTFNYGIDDKADTKELFISGDSSSVFEDEIENLNNGFGLQGTTEIKIRSFKEVYEELGVDTIDLLAINTEGCEYTTIPHILDNGYGPKIKNFQIQFHCHVDAQFPDGVENEVEKVRNQLSETHDLDWSYEWTFDNWSLK